MIRIIYSSPGGVIRNDVSLAELVSILKDRQGWVWVDFQGAPDTEASPILLNTFHFHPLAVDDALQENHVPKLDDWSEYLYIVLHALVFDSAELDIDTLELDVFLGSNYIVTHHDLAIEPLERVWSAVQRDERHIGSGTDFVLYRLTDEIIANFMPVVEQFDLQIDNLENEIFNGQQSETLEKIFKIKRAILFLRRILAHQREVVNKLARDEYQVIDLEDRIYFRDVYDHLVRLFDIAEGVRDMIGGTLDTYLSVINNRMNEIMKTLTVITTLFMPLSFITGFFGMNFFEPVGLFENWTRMGAFLTTLLIIGATPFVMVQWMHKRKWM
jgi:magnesium transporter